MASRYFSGLTYSLGDEDSRIESAILRPGAGTVAAIAGSGGRVIPLLARSPRRLLCADTNALQLSLTRLRLAALRAFDHPLYCAFFGFAGTPPLDAARRRASFERLPLDEADRSALTALFASTGWGEPLYIGRFERSLTLFSRIIRAACGRGTQALLDCTTLAEQAEVLRTRFPWTAWRAVTFLLGNSTALNAVLYKGEFPKRNRPESEAAIYRGIFDHLFATMPARESFFLQMLFRGRLAYAEGNPVEADPATFAQAKAALDTTELSYHLGDVVALLRAQPAGSVDFVSLSDVPSFFGPELDRTFLQALRPAIAPDGIVVFRGHLRLAKPDRSGFTTVSDAHAALIASERTGLWTIDVVQAAPVGALV